ncbi:MAG: hypothetical protein AAGM67_07385, partial [Bacteroidota bacterium]
MAPLYKKRKLKSIFSDCFLSKRLLEVLSISESCSLFYDTYHLLEQIFPSKLGRNLTAEVSNLLRELVFCTSEKNFLDSMEQLKRLYCDKRSIINYLEAWTEKRHMIAQYSRSRSFTLGRKGS